ncbi:hypothetical protein M3201_08200 [Paenibacillus motobuensis]|uniref:hypothetical protein n=1 Tax=Paenibacillus TaxID=44249 RepID=UPI00203F173B|nr:MULTISPECIES: hypothetical protein [Paenibacillus]MCM3039678.1 hypothetical protein [Paenibacillus lutimineralis]MCM3646782.1 hypothetical protein [Paenibacillus motobuensis]
MDDLNNLKSNESTLLTAIHEKKTIPEIISLVRMVMNSKNRSLRRLSLSITLHPPYNAPVFAVRTTAKQAASLIRAGVMRTIFRDTPPKPSNGKKVELKGVLFANDRIFSVFDVENSTDISVLVRINRNEANKLIRGGARIIKVIRKPF